MRFMIMVRANHISESDALPDEGIVTQMTDYHERLAAAGFLVDANGLRPSKLGWRVKYKGGKPAVVDGPYSETKELIAGYTIINVPDRATAIEWTRQFPAPFGPELECEIEVRQMFELDDLRPGEAVERFKQLMEKR